MGAGRRQWGVCEPGDAERERLWYWVHSGTHGLAGPSGWPPWWMVGGHGRRGGCCTIPLSRELSALVYVPGIIKILGTNSWLAQPVCDWNGVKAAGMWAKKGWRWAAHHRRCSGTWDVLSLFLLLVLREAQSIRASSGAELYGVDFCNFSSVSHLEPMQRFLPFAACL